MDEHPVPGGFRIALRSVAVAFVCMNILLGEFLVSIVSGAIVLVADPMLRHISR